MLIMKQTPSLNMVNEFSGKENTYQHSLPVGFPSPALEYLKEPLSIYRILAPNPLSTFFMNYEGNAMEGLIPHKAVMMIDTSLKAKSNQVAVLYIENEWMVRFVVFKNDECLLVPANPAYPVTSVTKDMELFVWGVVTRIIVDPKNHEHVCTGRL